MVALVKNCPTLSYQDCTLRPPPSLYKVQKYLSQLQITLILLISHISSSSYQAVQIIEYSRKAQTQSEVRKWGFWRKNYHFLVHPHSAPMQLMHRSNLPTLLYQNYSQHSI